MLNLTDARYVGWHEIIQTEARTSDCHWQKWKPTRPSCRGGGECVGGGREGEVSGTILDNTILSS